MNRVAILDYGLNNLKSVRKAVESCGSSPDIVSHGEEVGDPSGLILPGIGSFGGGMDELRERQFVGSIRDLVEDGTPILGICLGMQLLFSASHEFGYHEGLDLVAGEVVPFDSPEDVPIQGYKVPQTGWNEIFPPDGSDTGAWDNTLLKDVPIGADVYFVHSMYPEPDRGSDVLAIGEYGGQTFTAAVENDHIHGTQFHPEKSGPLGLDIVQRFFEIYDI